MLGSKNKFFKQDLSTLEFKRSDVYALLRIKGYDEEQISIYLKAFNFFIEHKEDYDGATIVKDLCDIPDLDLDAMLHDYHYFKYNVAKSFITKQLADWIYAKGQEKKGKGSYSSFSRYLILAVIGIIWVPYTALKKRKMSIDNEIYNDYKKLIK